MGRSDGADRRAALKWAEKRVREIREELDGLYRLFPELRSHAGPRKRRPPTAADRRKISQGMRKLWARRKAEQTKS
jgi:leucyl-tRNA synthetase